LNQFRRRRLRYYKSRQAQSASIALVRTDLLEFPTGSWKYEDGKVTVFGGTALAMGASKAKGADGSGKPIDEHVRWTDTWVKMPNGKWQCVASHVSAIKS
jgi:ketosteroid isomerase-like protein